MTKLFDLIHLNGHIYAVDKEALPIKEHPIYSSISNKILIEKHEYAGIKNETHWKVVSTSDPSLNLPLLPPIEEDIKALARIQWELNDDKQEERIKRNEFGMTTRKLSPEIREKFFQSYFTVFEQGYKAAKAKQYTEENLEKAFDSYPQNSTFNDFKNFLNPLPKQVEIEWVPKDPYSYDSCNDFSTYIPKVDANNFVTVKHWLYD